MRLNVFSFRNFFWATDSALKEDVLATGLEARTAMRLSSGADVYGNASVLKYDDSALSNAFGLRAGINRDGNVHDYNVFVDYAANRPSFVIRNNAGTADVSTLSGEYSYQFHPAWSVGGELVREQQNSEESSRDNDLTSAGVVVRYTGLGYRFTPHAALTTAKRDVATDEESYDVRAWRVGVEYIPIDPLYLSLTYRNMHHDFGTGDATSYNFGREDHGSQWEVVAAYRSSPRLQWLVYASRDHVDMPDDDVTASLVLFSVAYGF